MLAIETRLLLEKTHLHHGSYCRTKPHGSQNGATLMSPQNDNVLFAQSRNVLLTPSSWGGGRRTTTNDASRTGPPSLDYSSNLPVERRGECQMSDNKGVSHGEVLMEENTLCCGHSRRAKSLGLLRLLGPTR